MGHQSRGWKKTIDIKTLIHRDQENTDPVYVAKTGKELATLLRSNTAVDECETLAEVIKVFDTIDATDDDAVDVFNSALFDLYDWADQERVWLGL